MIHLDDTDYIVDRLHIKGHINTKYDIESRDCEFHPNTECAAQCISFLHRFGQMMRNMGKKKYSRILLKSSLPYFAKVRTSSGLTFLRPCMCKIGLCNADPKHNV